MILDGDFTPEKFDKARRMEDESLVRFPDGEYMTESELAAEMDIGTCQSCGRYHDLALVRTCPCGGYVG